MVASLSPGDGSRPAPRPAGRPRRSGGRGPALPPAPRPRLGPGRRRRPASAAIRCSGGWSPPCPACACRAAPSRSRPRSGRCSASRSRWRPPAPWPPGWSLRHGEPLASPVGARHPPLPHARPPRRSRPRRAGPHRAPDRVDPGAEPRRGRRRARPHRRRPRQGRRDPGPAARLRSLDPRLHRHAGPRRPRRDPDRRPRAAAGDGAPRRARRPAQPRPARRGVASLARLRRPPPLETLAAPDLRRPPGRRCQPAHPTRWRSRHDLRRRDRPDPAGSLHRDRRRGDRRGRRLHRRRRPAAGAARPSRLREIRARTRARPRSRPRLRAYFAGADVTAIDLLPVRTEGSPAMQRLWVELRRIPAGEVRSYAELGGDRRHARAAGTACARNPDPADRPLPPGGAHRRLAGRLRLGRRRSSAGSSTTRPPRWTRRLGGQRGRLTRLTRPRGSAGPARPPTPRHAGKTRGAGSPRTGSGSPAERRRWRPRSSGDEWPSRRPPSPAPTTISQR